MVLNSLSVVSLLFEVQENGLKKLRNFTGSMMYKVKSISACYNDIIRPITNP